MLILTNTHQCFAFSIFINFSYLSNFNLYIDDISVLGGNKINGCIEVRLECLKVSQVSPKKEVILLAVMRTNYQVCWALWRRLPLHTPARRNDEQHS